MRESFHSIRVAVVGFFRRRILPRPVRIALLGPEGSGKTTLLRAIDDPRYGYPLDDGAANRMDVNVPDQDTIAVPYRVFGPHRFRDFMVKDYRGTHFGSGQFHNRVVEGAEGVVVLLRSPRLANDSDNVRRLKKAYLDVCSKLSGVRAAVLLEVEPKKTPESKRAAFDAFLNELQKTIAASGVSEQAIKRWSFPTQRKNPSRQQWQESAKQAAAPFLWLAEQLDQSLWTWMRTRWWTWIVLASVCVSALFAAFVPGRPSGETHPDGGVESKGTNSVLHSDTETNALTETRRPRDGRIGHSQKDGTNAPPVSPFAKEIGSKQRYLASFEPKSDEWQSWERQRAAITNVLAWNLFDEACRIDTAFLAYVDSAIVANDEMAVDLFEKDVNSNLDWLEMVGRTQDMADFGNRLVSFSPLTDDSNRNEKLSRLRDSWINCWNSYKEDVTRTLRKYAVFARKYKDSAGLQNATALVANMVDVRLTLLSKKLEEGHDIASSHEELKKLCNALLSPMVSKTPFGTRWETEFAEWYRDASFKKNPLQQLRLIRKDDNPETK